MPAMNWDDVNEQDRPSREPLPKGKYLIKVKEIKKQYTQSGDAEMWNLTCVVMSGEHKKRLLWDRWVFKGGAYPIIKGACIALGFLPAGEHILVPADILNRGCWADVGQESYMKDGSEKMKNKITGFEKASEGDLAVISGDADDEYAPAAPAQEESPF